jgi:hypothetical protein
LSIIGSGKRVEEKLQKGQSFQNILVAILARKGAVGFHKALKFDIVTLPLKGPKGAFGISIMTVTSCQGTRWIGRILNDSLKIQIGASGDF